MKISNDTRNVLKNFSTINSGIRVKTGNTLETISNMKNILAVATVDESFPKDFSIYNLNEFLGATSLLDDADYQFNDSSLTVTDSNTSLSYFYASEGMVTAPDKMITMPDSEIKIDISSSLLSELQKAASVLGVNDLILKSDGTIYSVTVLSSTAGLIATTLCESAITKRSPFRAWTQEMIQVFGEQKELRVRFYYR